MTTAETTDERSTARPDRAVAGQPVVLPTPISKAGSHKGEFYIPSLDGVRAFSFFLVFLSHGVFHGKVPGGLGVTTFFFLSGYLITTLLRLEQERHGRISLKQFYLRRSLRILPPMYLAMAFGIVMYLILKPEMIEWWSLLIQALHLTNYRLFWMEGEALKGLDVLWSLAVEEHFYLVFPLLYIAMQKTLSSRMMQAAVMGLICVATLGWRCYLAAHSDLTITDQLQRVSLATDTRLDSLLLGCMLAVCFNPAVDQYRLSTWVSWLLGVLGFGLVAASTVMGDLFFRETFRYTLQGVGLIAVFVIIIKHHTVFPFTILNHKWIRHIGVLSYSLYLFHYLVIVGVKMVADGRLHPLLVDLVSFVLSLLIAQGMFVLVERPCARLRKRLGRVNPASTPNTMPPGEPQTPPAATTMASTAGA